MVEGAEGEGSVRTHRLKAWPEFFRAVWDRSKQFELREDDRGYDIGDGLVLEEYEPMGRGYTGREIAATITYKMPGGRFGLAQHLCVLGLGILENKGSKAP